MKTLTFSRSLSGLRSLRVLAFAVAGTFAATAGATNLKLVSGVNGGTPVDGGMPYLLHVPSTYDANPTNYYPTLIFLHGDGERCSPSSYGTTNELHKVENPSSTPPGRIKGGDPMTFQVNGQTESLIVISPQLRTGRPWTAADVIGILDDAIAKGYRIDQNRVYLTGFSLGGQGVWDVLMQAENSPNRFAAAAPVHGRSEQKHLHNIIAERNIAIWCLTSLHDNTVHRAWDVLAAMRTLRDAYPTAEVRFTMFEESNYYHSCEKEYRTDNSIFAQENLYQWMLTKTLQPAAWSAPNNVAKASGVVAASGDPNSNPSKLRDGYLSAASVWKSTSSDMSVKWATYDLGTARTIHELIVFHARTVPTTISGMQQSNLVTKGYTLEGKLNAGDPWTTLATVTNNWEMTTTHKIAPTSLRYIRLSIQQPNRSTSSPNESNVWELEVNEAPSSDVVVANADSATTNENTPVDINVLANDLPSSGLSIQSVGTTPTGTTQIVGSQVRYTPNPGFHGQATFNYTAIATSGSTGQADVTVTVVNTAQAQNLSGAGLTGSDIGSGSGGGSRAWAGGVWEVTGSGSGLAGTADSFHFESAGRAGDFQMVVRVTDMYAPGASAPRAGLMLRESNSAGARMAYVAVTPSAQFAWGARTTNGGTATAQTGTSTFTYPNAWLLLQREGDVITLATSTDNQNFTQVNQVTLTGLSAMVEAGVFSSSGSSGVTALAMMEDFQVFTLGAPVSHWKLDETSGTTAVDTMGLASGTASGNTAWSSSGQIDGAIELLDGTNDYVVVPNRTEYSGTTLSLALWFNTGLLDGQPRGLISKRSGVNNQLAFSAFIHTGNRIFVDIPTGPSASQRFDTGYAVSGTGEWHHFAMVFDGAASTNRLKVYVDGVQVYQATPTATAIPATTAPIVIGCLNTGYGTSFKGLIDDVRVYKYALSAADVEELLAIQDTLEDGLVAKWQCDDGSGTTLTDELGVHHGGLAGAATWTSSGYIDGALRIPSNGSNFVSVADSNDFHGTALSAALWFKPSVLDGNPRGLISKRANATTAKAFSVYMNGANNRLYVSVGDELYDSGYSVTSVNTWYHVAMVFDGSLSSNQLRLYVNGTEVFSTTTTATAIPDTYALLTIGSLNYNYTYSFLGDLDEIRLYGRALTAGEVAQLAE
jgi:hypothetical protein